MKIVKHMKKRAMGLMLCLCLLAGLVSGCSAPKEKPMGEADTWSVFLYLCGSNLETQMGAAGKNLDEILAADIPDNVNVVIRPAARKNGALTTYRMTALTAGW